MPAIYLLVVPQHLLEPSLQHSTLCTRHTRVPMHKVLALLASTEHSPCGRTHISQWCCCQYLFKLISAHQLAPSPRWCFRRCPSVCLSVSRITQNISSDYVIFVNYSCGMNPLHFRVDPTKNGRLVARFCYSVLHTDSFVCCLRVTVCSMEATPRECSKF